MTPGLLLQTAIRPAFGLLPERMRSDAAAAMLVAIALQESALRHRRQMGGGPAKSFWQFEHIGVAGVVQHPSSAPHVAVVSQVLGYGAAPDPARLHVAIEHNDVLAAALARCLLWTVPERLPAWGEPDMAWQQYLAAWRPGRPRQGKWAANYDAGWVSVNSDSGGTT